MFFYFFLLEMSSHKYCFFQSCWCNQAFQILIKITKCHYLDHISSLKRSLRNHAETFRVFEIKTYRIDTRIHKYMLCTSCLLSRHRHWDYPNTEYTLIDWLWTCDVQDVSFATFCKRTIFSIVTWISIPFNVSTMDLILFQSSVFLDSTSK